MKDDQHPIGLDALLLDINDSNNLGGTSMPPQPAGFVGYPQPPLLPASDFKPFNYPVYICIHVVHEFYLSFQLLSK